MEIYVDRNGVQVKAINFFDGKNEGCVYQINHGDTHHDLKFQTGGVSDSGVNGLTNEALLAIVIHRTNSLNDKFPCKENACAITKMQEALMWFESRTKQRIDRGVEGQEVA